jgi:hypothetical protein
MGDFPEKSILYETDFSRIGEYLRQKGGPDLTLPKLLWCSNFQSGCAMPGSAEAEGR